MPVRIRTTHEDLARTLRLHLGDLVEVPGHEVTVGDARGVEIRVGPEYLRPKTLPVLVSRALARFGHEEPLHAGLVEQTIALRRAVRSRLGLPAGRGPKFLLRVDDFPRWDRPLEQFVGFHESLRGAPYLLAATPMLSANPLDPEEPKTRGWTPAEQAFLARIQREGATLALHGFTHRTRQRRPHSELAGLGEEATGKLVDDALAAFGGRPTAFVPPFNHFDAPAFRALASRFDIVSAGGRESPRSFGAYTSPAFVEGALYVPCYAPAYGRAKGVAAFAAKLVAETDEELWVPLTVHWAWEHENGYADVVSMVESLAGRLHPWQEFASDARRSLQSQAA